MSETQMCTKIHCVTPPKKGKTRQGERKMRDYERQSLCFWLCIVLTTHNSNWFFHGNLSKMSKMRQLLMTAQWEKEYHWMHLIDLKDDKSFTLKTRSVGREESKAWALSVVPHFSLSPWCLTFLMWGDTMYFHVHLRFARSTIPEGNWWTTIF